jgi:hypothetical protein
MVRLISKNGNMKMKMMGAYSGYIVTSTMYGLMMFKV